MGSKNKERLREFRRQQELQKGYEAIATPRPYWQDVDCTGIGALCIRIVSIDSGGITECWEIRQQEELKIFHSQGVPDNEILVVGMTPLAITHQELDTIIERFESLQLAPKIKTDPTGVLDGIWIVVRLEGGIQCSSQFKWVRGRCPESWLSLESIVLSLIDRFREIEP
ncbi:hypothetical protein [Chamaesiphon polymorphus]|uniref:Uncharacterized protein n=1 Tax=Chamaesiphon polymorphus CCALA 037 TaxID=2107692 RepID=A0A2T1GGD1_9CYAN|nr:hypothetical protein [Chamaesiphon polymorphus]PSB56564.1 hypothetical protein C7B77_11450 [Chamaesiphon polymorphus CCALA 037]